MFVFSADPALPKTERYRQLAEASSAIIAGESDAIANMANITALMWEFIPGLNWAGFYRVVGNELVLGPFIGRPACIRIGMGKGVCGTAATTGTTQLVQDVHAFPGHIACDAASRSELVVPVLCGGAVFAVIDLDSPELAHFDEEDAAGIEKLAERLAERLPQRLPSVISNGGSSPSPA